MGDIKVILVGVVVGLLCSVILYGFIAPQMRLWWRKRAGTGDEQFHPDELTSTQSGLREPEVDQIEFESADVIASRLEEIWQFDLSGLPTAQEEVEEVADVPDWLARPGDEGVPEAALREPEWFAKLAPTTPAEVPEWLPAPLSALEQEAAPPHSTKSS